MPTARADWLFGIDGAPQAGVRYVLRDTATGAVVRRGRTTRTGRYPRGPDPTRAYTVTLSLSDLQERTVCYPATPDNAWEFRTTPGQSYDVVMSDTSVWRTP